MIYSYISYIGQGEGQYLAEDENRLNFVNPFISDSVTGYPTSLGNRRNNVHAVGVSHSPCGWLVIQFTANNPGIWMLHCHIEWHLSMGMGVIFDVQSKSLFDTDEKRSKIPNSFKNEYCGDISKDTLHPYGYKIYTKQVDSKYNTKKMISQILFLCFLILFLIFISVLLRYYLRKNNVNLFKMIMGKKDNDVVHAVVIEETVTPFEAHKL
jgi:hypothetical protein